MSSSTIEAADVCCANCGAAEILLRVVHIQLENCDGGCDLVKYCSKKCREEHREQHADECKKRKVELHDKELFTQPDSSHMGECPICCLPLSIDPNESKTNLMPCCCKFICIGCHYANQKRENEAGLEHRCAYCREPVVESQETSDRRIMKRIKKNDPVALMWVGSERLAEGDYRKALEYFTKAAELGNAEAHFSLSTMYRSGDGVGKDKKKEVYHAEQAAIGGHPQARNNLMYKEARNSHVGEQLGDPKMKNDYLKRAAKHALINANLGYDPSLKAVKSFFVQGIVSKEDYAAALRGCQAAVNATKSAERKTAETFFNNVSADRGGS